MSDEGILEVELTHRTCAGRYLSRAPGEGARHPNRSAATRMPKTRISKRSIPLFVKTR